MSISAVSFFCEDIRTEATGLEMLIGMLPDKILIPGKVPFAFPKLGIFTRINFTLEDAPSFLSISVLLPNGEEFIKSDVDKSQLEESISSLKSLPIAGIKMQIIAGNLTINELGTIKAVVKTDGGEILSGILNMQLVEDGAIGSNA